MEKLSLIGSLVCGMLTAVGILLAWFYAIMTGVFIRKLQSIEETELAVGKSESVFKNLFVLVIRINADVAEKVKNEPEFRRWFVTIFWVAIVSILIHMMVASFIILSRH